MYRSLQKHELILDDVIKELILIIIRLGITAGVKELKEDVELSIEFDDSIIEDKQAKRNEDRKDVSMGAMSLVEYRMRNYGETEDEAIKKIPEQNAVME